MIDPRPACPCSRPCDSVETLSPIMTGGTEFRFRRGQVLWRAGEPATWLMALCSGTIKLVRARDARTPIVLDLMGRGDMAGEEAARADGRRAASCVALTGGRAMRMERDELADLFRREPELAMILLERSCARAEALSARMEALVRDPVEQRLAQTIDWLGRERGLSDARGRFVPLRLTRRELAGLVGCREETVTRLMAAWQREGVLETRREGMILRDVRRIRDIARAA